MYHVIETSISVRGSAVGGWVADVEVGKDGDTYDGPYLREESVQKLVFSLAD